MNLSSPSHALYISVTEIDISESLEVKMVVKVFSNDLYSSMLNHESTITSSESNWVIAEVYDYITDKIKLNNDGVHVPLSLREVSIEGESTFLHIEGQLDIESKGLDIRLGHFYELFPSQRNILKLNNGDHQEHSIFKSAAQVNHYELH